MTAQVGLINNECKVLVEFVHTGDCLPTQGHSYSSALHIGAMLGCKINVFISSDSQKTIEKQAFM